jgi:hypothetical protein
MKLSLDAIVSIDKMSNYLLRWRPENDKSQFLAQAGYTERDASRLANDIRDQPFKLEAEFEQTTEYGEFYSIAGSLIGRPNEKAIRVISIWMIERVTKTTKFITLYPARENR